MAAPRQRLPLPTLESPPSRPGEDSPGADLSNDRNTPLALSSMVPNGQDDVSRSPLCDTATPRASSSRKRPRHSGQESSLVFNSMAHKRRRPEDEGCDDQPTIKYATIEDHEIVVPHHKDESVPHRPLICDVRFPKTTVTSQTISSHIAAITDLLGLPPNKTRPKARAIGPAGAIKKGAHVNDVIFNNYYRLTRATATNLTSLVSLITSALDPHIWSWPDG
ncbi:hypothetical protein KI688_011240 [Linnemannia hyalina]|uniref:Uncharacterized protein n=1 Tax=Linnemannia hyalina TaxID=64524 RepID=A0A9P7XVY2_9FUNG|nr:hypothetical protein KI688_011240 [Linnemannia hyalina]